jgi:hypothetical protein
MQRRLDTVNVRLEALTDRLAGVIDKTTSSSGVTLTVVSWHSLRSALVNHNDAPPETRNRIDVLPHS